MSLFHFPCNRKNKSRSIVFGISIAGLAPNNINIDGSDNKLSLSIKILFFTFLNCKILPIKNVSFTMYCCTTQIKLQ